MKKELAKAIGTVARSARLAQHMTQEDAAERIKVSVEFYARIERGTSLPSVETFARIVLGLGVSADALLGRSPIAVTVVQPDNWTPVEVDEAPEIRRLLRRLRKARPQALRLVGLLLKDLEANAPSNHQVLNDGSSSATTDPSHSDE